MLTVHGVANLNQRFLSYVWFMELSIVNLGGQKLTLQMNQRRTILLYIYNFDDYMVHKTIVRL